MTATDDLGLQVVSSATAVVINGLIVAGMLLAGLSRPGEEPNPEPPALMVSVEELPRLGKEPEPEALPRIVQPPPPAPPETDTASLSREIEEQEEKKREDEKKERALAEEKKRDEEKLEKEELARQRKEARERKKAMQDALDHLKDPRADDEDAPGFAEGDRHGTSSDPNSLYNKQVYLSQIKLLLQRAFVVPANIPADERKRLKATVQFNIDDAGKVKGTPRLARPSGNHFFDEAALAAVRKFSVGSALKLPLPKDDNLRRAVLKDGLAPTLEGKSAN